MLISLTLENLLSFSEPFTLDLRAPRDPDPDAAQCPIPDGDGDGAVRRTALVVGRNGTGKSNLLRAMVLVRNLLLASVRPGKSLPLPLFLLGSEFRPEARIELSVLQAGEVWTYQLAATRERVLSEQLTARGPAGTRMLFSRRATTAGKAAIELGEVSPADRQRLELVATYTRPEQPMLGESLRQGGVPALLPLGTWLRDRLQIVRSEARIAGLAARMSREPQFAAFVSELVAEADLGVTAVATRRVPVDHDFFKDEAEEREVLTALTGYADGFVQTAEGEIIAERDPEVPTVLDLFRVSLVFEQRTASGRSLELSLGDAPDGLLRLLHLAPAFYAGSAELPPQVFLIDELDRSLHPALTRRLLDRFAAPWAPGPHGAAQLIATTHDHGLIDPPAGRAHVIRLTRDGNAGTRLET